MSNFLVNKVEGDTLEALEWNQLAEINNLILSSGQTLDGNTLEQVAKAVANYVNSGNFYTENGVANAYTLVASGSFKAPTSYANGMVVRFITTNANTLSTATINVAGLGNKNIKKADGSNLVAGDISGYVELRYNGTDFLLSPLSSALNITATNKGLTYLNNPITIANNSTDANNDIDFTAGNFQFADGSGQAVLSAITKRLDASWTAGNNQGGLDTGTKANSTWYHCYAIYNPTSGISDAIFSTNATSPSLPAGYTKYKRIGSVKTNASGNILSFLQRDKFFEWKDVVKDLDTTSVVATKTPIPISAPLGIQTIVVCRAGVRNGASLDFNINFLTEYNNSLQPPNIDGGSYDSDIGSDNTYLNGTNFLIATNLNSQIYYIGSRVATIDSFLVRTKGYYDYTL